MAQGPVTTGEYVGSIDKKAGGRFNGVDAVPLLKRKRQPESFGAPERVLFNVKVNYFGASAAQGGHLTCPGSTGALAPCLPGRVACRCSSCRLGRPFSAFRKSERGERKDGEKRAQRLPAGPEKRDSFGRRVRSLTAWRRCFPCRAPCSPRLQCL